MFFSGISLPFSKSEKGAVYLVQVKEKPQSVPAGEKIIEWTLYTSHQVTSHTQILHLRQARGGKTPQQTELFFSKEHVECMQDLIPKLEGKSEKQKNPFDKQNLAWATWIIARGFGWNTLSS